MKMTSLHQEVLSINGKQEKYLRTLFFSIPRRGWRGFRNGMTLVPHLALDDEQTSQPREKDVIALWIDFVLSLFINNPQSLSLRTYFLSIYYSQPGNEWGKVFAQAVSLLNSIHFVFFSHQILFVTKDLDQKKEEEREKNGNGISIWFHFFSPPPQHDQLLAKQS